MTTENQNTPAVVAEIAPSNSTPKVKSYSGNGLSLTKDNRSISLTPVKTQRGSDKWTYPSVPCDTKEEVTASYKLVSSYLTADELAMLTVESFDRECQQAWRQSQDTDKFITAMTTGGRQPKIMSLYYDGLIKECGKRMADLKAKGAKPEELAAVRAEAQGYWAKFKEAQETERLAKQAEVNAMLGLE